LKTSLLRISVFILCAILIQTSAFAGGFQLNEHGARAMAQGGAWAARAYDASAIYFNPAGLAFQKKNSAYVGTTLIMPKSTFYGPTNQGQSTKNEMVSQVFTPINLYGTYRLTEDINFGFGVYNPFGLGTEWPSTWSGRYISQKVDLQSFFFTPTVAYTVSDQFSVGIGVSYVRGSVTLSKIASAATFGGTDPQVKLDLSGSGVGYNIGFLYKPVQEFSIGLSFRTAVELTATGTAKFTPSSVLFPTGDAEAYLKLPDTGFLGFSFRPMANLEIEGDYQYVGWSTYRQLKIDFKSNNTSSISPKNYNDAFILRFGAEYTMDELQLRCGYLYDSNPVPDKYVEPLLPDANRHGLNIGAGYKINDDMFVDVAYLFLKFNERGAYNTEVQFDGIYQASANLLGVNFGYHF
jgi:long-chain fatty acid transport protein